MEIWLKALIAFVFGLGIGLWLTWMRKLRQRSLYTSQELLKQIKGKFTKISVGEIHYHQVGSGPHLLLIHGIGASTYCWRFVLGPLSKRFTVTAIDLVGFGQSVRPRDGYGLDDQCKYIIEFLDQMKIRQCRIIGHSMGGAIALWLAKLHPDRVLEVSCLNPATQPNLVPIRASQLNLFSRFIGKALNEATMRTILGRVYGRKENITTEAIQNYLAPYNRYPEALKSFLKSTELIRDKRLPWQLKTVSCPVQVLWGGRDKMVREHHIRDLLRVVQQARLIVHRTAGHHIMEDEPAWVVEQTESFFLGQSD